jgi:sirohydrochlorin ferrochelatase
VTAPALVTLACGPIDAQAARVVRDIVTTTRRLRPDLRTSAAFTGGRRPSLAGTVTELAGRGIEEIVVVPLLVAATDQSELEVGLAVAEAAHVSPGLLVRASGPIGADASLLGVLDQRLRSALSASRVRELDAVVLAATGSSDARANAAIGRLARLWGARHHLPTSVAFANAAPPSTGEAVRDWRRQGKRHVAVGSIFITSGPYADRAAELAEEAGACAVSAPLGAHEALSRLIVSRYSVGALELVPV